MKSPLKCIRIKLNDDKSVSIAVEVAPAKAEKGGDHDDMIMWGGELTATAPSFEKGLEKIKEMYNLECGKGKKPKDVVTAYLEG